MGGSISSDADVSAHTAQKRELSLGSSLRTSDDTPTLGERAAISRMEAALFGRSDPVRVGRYAIQHRIGAGTFGSVYAAFDGKLQRQVALKIVRADTLHFDDRDKRRLLREARAMATVSHPNVAAIYDADMLVGEDGRQLFIAMELVEGRTLREWRSARRWTPQQILDVLIQAGRGLAAAHAAGVVHRDFKPENVLIGVDGSAEEATGRVRVVDFGLARSDGVDDEGAPSVSNSSSDPDGLSQLVTTVEGGMAGTPAYMSPEHFRRGAITPQSDQFSFCVTAWEMLFCERPFPGHDAASIGNAVMTGSIRALESGHGVSARVVRVLRRGLSLAPCDRYPSMNALLEALSAAHGTRLRRGAIVVVCVSALGGAGLATTLMDRRTCDGSTALASTWSTKTAEALEQHLGSIGRSYAVEAARQTRQRLDAYAQGWLETHNELCRAHAKGFHSDRAYDLQRECLERRRGELDTLASVLLETDADTLAYATTAVERLMPVTDCKDIETLEAGVEPIDEAHRARANRARERLSHVQALHAAGRLVEAEHEARALVEATPDLPAPSLRATALHELARLHAANGNPVEAVQREIDAWNEALAGGADRQAVLAGASLVATLGNDLRSFDEADMRAREVDSLLARMRRRGIPKLDPLEAELRVAEGDVAYRRRNYDAARAAYEGARRLLDSAYGPDHPLIIEIDKRLAAVTLARRDFSACVDAYRAVLDELRRMLGDDHPRVAEVRNNLGLCLKNTEAFDEAIEQLERALASKLEFLGEDHPRVALLVRNLAGTEQARGNYPAAVRYYERLLVRYGEPFPVGTAELLRKYAKSLDGVGRMEDAQRWYERAIEVAQIETEYDPGIHSRCLTSWGAALIGRKRYDEAVTILEESVATYVAGDDPTVPGWSHLALARALWAQGHQQRAIQEAEIAKQIAAAIRSELGVKQLAVIEEQIRAWSR